MSRKKHVQNKKRTLSRATTACTLCAYEATAEDQQNKRAQLKRHMYSNHDCYLDEYGQFVLIKPTSLLAKMRKARFTDCSLELLLGVLERSGPKRAREINAPKHFRYVELA